MSVPLLVFAGALVLTIGITPVARWLASRMGVMDKPEARKVHRRPVPRVGGITIYLAIIIAAYVLGQGRNFNQLGSTLVGTTATFGGFFAIGPLVCLSRDLGCADIRLRQSRAALAQLEASIRMVGRSGVRCAQDRGPYSCCVMLPSQCA